MNKFLLTVISVLLSLIAGGVGYTVKKVYVMDQTVIAMKQHLVDKGWHPVAALPNLFAPPMVAHSGPPVCSSLFFLPPDIMSPAKNKGIK